MLKLESERFVIQDEDCGWLTIIRRGGGELSIQGREVADLSALLQAVITSGRDNGPITP